MTVTLCSLTFEPLVSCLKYAVKILLRLFHFMTLIYGQFGRWAVVCEAVGCPEAELVRARYEFSFIQFKCSLKRTSLNEHKLISASEHWSMSVDVATS